MDDRMLWTFAICAVLALSVPVNADPNAEFTAAYEAYREAMESSRYFAAVGHAEKARRLGEEIYADDIEVRATLAFNHGHAQAVWGAKSRAYTTLKEASKLMRQAHGRNSKEVLQVETALLETAPDHAARRQLTQVLKLARQHYPDDSDLMAETKLTGGIQVWWDRRAIPLLREAAETFARLGKTERQAYAMFWIGKIHVGRAKYAKAVESMTPVVDLLPADDTIALMARANLVEAYEKLGERDKATEHCLAIGRTTPWAGTANYQPLFKRPPTYPRSAAARSAEGYVLLEFTVDEMGFVRDTKVVEARTAKDVKPSAQPDIVWAFEKAAIEAAGEFRYAPKFVDGEPVPVEGVRNRIVFRMRH